MSHGFRALGSLFVLPTHHEGQALLLEVRDVVRGRERRVPVGRDGARVVRAREREELAVHDPVEVAVLDLLKVLVLLDVKVLAVEEVELHRLREPAQAVEHGEVERARARRRVVERRERRVHAAERAVRLLGRLCERESESRDARARG